MRILCVILVSLLMMSLPSYASTAQKDTVTVITQWLPQAQFAGIIMAYEKGFYEEAGIEAEIKYAQESVSSIDMLENGEADIITSMLVDAMVATEYNEYFQIMMAGIDIGEGNIIRLRDEGYDIPEDGIYTTEQYYSSHKDVVDRFVRATVRGWEWVRNPDNLEETVDTITGIMRRMNIPASKVNQKYMLKTVLRLQEDSTGHVPYRLDPSRFDFTVRMLRESNFILETIDYDDFVHTPDTDS